MNNIIETLEKAAYQAVGSMADDLSAAAIEQRLWEAYRDLGRQYYETIQQGGKPEGPGFQAHMRRISDLLIQLRDKRNR